MSESGEELTESDYSYEGMENTSEDHDSNEDSDFTDNLQRSTDEDEDYSEEEEDEGDYPPPPPELGGIRGYPDYPGGYPLPPTGVRRRAGQDYVMNIRSDRSYSSDSVSVHDSTKALLQDSAVPNYAPERWPAYCDFLFVFTSFLAAVLAAYYTLA